MAATKKSSSGIQRKQGGKILERMGYVGVFSFGAFCLYFMPTLSKMVKESDTFAKASLAVCAVAYVAWLAFAWQLTFIEDKAHTLAKGGSARDHLISPVTLMGKLRWAFWQTTTHSFVMFPICVGLSIAYLQVMPTFTDLVFGILVHFVLTLIPMSVCLHRFFSHGAYKANRALTAVIAVVACLAYQYGPIWWSAHHRRHHKHCDEMKDPHSWARFGLGYAWIGWTMHPCEQTVEHEFVHRVFKRGNKHEGEVFPELMLIDKCFMVPSWLMHAFLFFVVGVPLHTIVYRYTMPSCLCSIATLWFNCKFHPPTEKAEMVCNSIDLLSDPLATFHGEAFHHDHHKFPNKAQRPGADLGWYCVIRPLLALGVISEA